MDEFPAAGSFTHVVGEYLTRSGYNICQVARLAGLPRRTVANWLDGVVTSCWGEVFGQCETPPGCGPASSPRRLFCLPATAVFFISFALETAVHPQITTLIQHVCNG